MRQKSSGQLLLQSEIQSNPFPYISFYVALQFKFDVNVESRQPLPKVGGTAAPVADDTSTEICASTLFLYSNVFKLTRRTRGHCAIDSVSTSNVNYEFTKLFTRPIYGINLLLTLFSLARRVGLRG